MTTPRKSSSELKGNSDAHAAMFPIDALLPEIIESLKGSTRLLLEASPGAGKTTRVPAALVAAGYGKVMVLEPRRLACRMAARHVAKNFHQDVGGLVGYQVRFEVAGSANTKIWYLTEGVLSRRLLSGDLLPDVKTVILDEFHERHLETDLSLALLLSLQQVKRPDLRLVLMSATLGSSTIREKLQNPPLIKSAGRLYPVRIQYTPYSAAPLAEQVAGAVTDSLRQTSGDVLVFLPGAAEIRESIRSCEGLVNSAGAVGYALHGDLPPEQQDRAVQPGPERKVIFSTNVAESSITIEGVDAVVDSGLARILSYSPWNGLPSLKVEKVNQASVIQRSGRAGRLRPGFAIRLFTESDFLRRPDHITPEIVRADLAPTILQLGAAGVSVEDLHWLDVPVAEHLEQARELLARLEAFGPDGKITPLGRRMAMLPIHPRLARFVVAAAEMGAAQEAARFTARLSEARHSFFMPAARAVNSDIDLVLQSDASYAVKKLQNQILRSLPSPTSSQSDPFALEKALLLGFPDRVAKRRGEALLMSFGGSARLDKQSHVQSEFLVALEIEDRSDLPNPLVRLASEIKAEWLLDFFPVELKVADELVWNAQTERVEQRQAILYGAISIEESRSVPQDREAARRILLAKAGEAGIDQFVDRDELSRFLARIEFASKHASFAIPSDLLDRALEAMASGALSFAELKTAARDAALISILEGLLPMRKINEVAPPFVHLPSGRRARIQYHADRAPSVASRLQDFFGLQRTPAVALGKVPLVVELLAPNQRPVQVTTDLVSFWRDLYPKVRRELSRRYPKHSWPETPA